MIIKSGLYKNVFIFKNIAIKLPRGIKGIWAILSEQYGYMTVDKDKKGLLLRIYFIPFIPINIQKKIKVCSDCDLQAIQEKFGNMSYKRFEVFTDIKSDNFGWYNGNIVKIDYDFIWYWYNVKVRLFGFDEKNIDMKLHICIWKKLKFKRNR